MRRGGGNQVFTVAWEEAKTFSPPPPPPVIQGSLLATPAKSSTGWEVGARGWE